MTRKLAETGDTPKSFLVKGGIGCAVLAAIGIFVLWVLYRGVRGFFG
jgi:LPXTG-motif cell wall-anchored protein